MRETLKLVKVLNFLLPMVLEVKVVAHPRADSFFKKERAKVIFF